MAIQMKALKDFRGEPGEGNTQVDNFTVVADREFMVAHQGRANDLEARGLAIQVGTGHRVRVPPSEAKKA